MRTEFKRWGVKWRSRNRIDGVTECLMWGDGHLLLFRTKHDAREWIVKAYGYIRTRRDLRREPHGWRMPQPVRVRVLVETLDGRD